MSRLTLLVLTAALVLAATLPAAAHPTVPLNPTLPADVTYAATDNIEYLGRFPEHFGAAGGRVGPAGDRFYVTDPRGVYVYDTTDPASPDLLGSLRLFQSGTGAALAQEDVDTDGEILLVDAAPTPTGSAQLNVVDVSDPANLRVLSTVDETDHTWTCVSALAPDGGVDTCAYAYGRTGHIVDLTDPAQAKLLSASWRRAVGYTAYAHDLTEIRPGLVMSAGADAVLMDTSDPTAPVRLGEIRQRTRWSQFGYHSVEWANGGRDPFLVAGTELAPNDDLAGSDCEGEDSVIETWDASEFAAALEAYAAGTPWHEASAGAEFTKIDAFDAGGRGIFLQGSAPSHLLYCAHWMELHPDFDGGGKMVVSYYDRGTRFVDVAADGTMEEIGWIVPADGYSGSAQWVSDDVVYIMDYRRGLEVVRLTEEPATGVYRNRTAPIALTSAYAAPAHAGPQHSAILVAAALAGLLVVTEVRRLRRERRAERRSP